MSEQVSAEQVIEAARKRWENAWRFQLLGDYIPGVGRSWVLTVNEGQRFVADSLAALLQQIEAHDE